MPVQLTHLNQNLALFSSNDTWGNVTPHLQSFRVLSPIARQCQCHQFHGNCVSCFLIAIDSGWLEYEAEFSSRANKVVANLGLTYGSPLLFVLVMDPVTWDIYTSPYT